MTGVGARETVVTGVGVVAPGGVTREEFWDTITAGRTATRRITFFDPSGFRSQIAAECDFDPRSAGLDDQEAFRMDRYIRFAVAAGLEALRDSGLDLEQVARDRVAVSLGSAVGGTMYLEDGYVLVSNRGKEWLVNPEYSLPFLYQALVPSSLASEVALKFGAHGPAVVVSTGCTSGIDAIGFGHQLIQDGEADIVIAGASESGISPISMACFDPIKATSSRNDEPEHASRPFDRDRDGFVMGEGGAILILEERERALARGAHIYCKVAGFASRGNAFHMTGLKADGLDMAEAIGDAMRQARLQPEDIDYINAHGSGTKQNDRHETAAYKKSLGQQAYEIPISSIKSMIGHSLGGIGALEMAACALVIDNGVIPPTANWENRDPECDLDYTPRVARQKDVAAALSTGSGFGGFQSAMIFTRDGKVGAETTRAEIGAPTLISTPNRSRRAVITGIGVVAPNGLGSDAWWNATKSGRSGIGRITHFDPSRYATQLAGEVDGFEPNQFIDQRLRVQTDRWTWMALAATQMALQDAGFDPSTEDPYRMSVITASSSGGNEFGQKEIQSLWARGPIFVGAYQSIAWFYAATTGQISIKYGMKGPSGVLVTEGAGALDALWHSRRVIQRGVDVVVSGGTEAPIGPYALTCQMKSGYLSEARDPEAAYRPFDAGANGYVPGEGGAILLVEDFEYAQARGAHIYGEIVGYAATQDAYHYSRIAPDGEDLRRAMSLALESARMTPDDVDAVFADAAGTLDGDRCEARAIRAVFGDRSVPVTAPKSMTGRLYAGGAAVDTAAALLAMRDGCLPPIVNLDQPAPDCDLDFVRGSARATPVNTVLINARGFGGFNSALLVSTVIPTLGP